MKSIAELAKEHMNECYFADCKVGISKNRNLSLKNTTCIMCGRNMTVKKWEEQPHYCYKCNDEAEGVFQDY